MEQSAFGKIIMLNGASSAGKSTLCGALQKQLDEPFLQFSLDFFFFDDRVLPKRREESGEFAWAVMRPKLFEGYYNCLPALAGAGNNLVIDYVVETYEQLQRLVQLLRGFDVFYVGVHCSVEELERRERQRGDRSIGDARRDWETVHSFSGYDFEIDSTLPAEQNAETIIAVWKSRKEPSVFELMGQ